MLLLNMQTLLSKPVHQSVLVDLFQMAIPMILVNGETSLPNDIAEFIDVRVVQARSPCEDIERH